MAALLASARPQSLGVPHPARRGQIDRQRLFVLACLILAVVPLAWPAIPPLVDVPNHMSGYAIGLDYARNPAFRQWFDFHWVLVGNLGVNLLVAALGPLLGVEPATKLVVIGIPLVTVAGMALIAREAHGRVPLAAAFAFPFAYNFSFTFGFLNFTLSAGLALLAFGLWLRLGRLERRGTRAAIFVPIGVGVWLAHACGWGMLGIMVFAAELIEARRRRAGWARATVTAAIACLPLAVAMLPMLHWLGAKTLDGTTAFALDPVRKIALLFAALSAGHPPIDALSMLPVCALLAAAAIGRGFRFEPRVGAAALALFFAYLVMPVALIGSYHADVRIAPYAVAVALLAVRTEPDFGGARAVGIAALAFLVARTAYLTASYAQVERAWTAQLAALDHLPRGSRVFALARVACLSNWEGDRMDNLNRMAIVRRQAFTNGTWPPGASQTLAVRPAMTQGYRNGAADSGSQQVLPRGCRARWNTIPGALASFPRERFDHVWLIGIPPRLWPTRSWLRPVWHGDDTILYRILRPAAAVTRRPPAGT